MINIILDMETSDPDDFLTLLFLAGHSKVNLTAVTVTPGSNEQVGLIKWGLHKLNKDIPVGAGKAINTNEPKYVSQWHYTNFGKIKPFKSDCKATEILYSYSSDNMTLLQCGPIHNLSELFKSKKPYSFDKVVTMGGFAGEKVMVGHTVIPKFHNRNSYPTYNLMGFSRIINKLQESTFIKQRYFITKNLTHRVAWDKELDIKVAEYKDKPDYLILISEVMHKYLNFKPGGKKLHDILAGACAIDQSIFKYVEGNLYPFKNGYGTKLENNTNTFVSIDYDKDKFFSCLLDIK